MPTEKEWEFAAKGGLIGREYSWGENETEAQDCANFAGIGGKDEWDESTAPVGSLEPNDYGLYDMADNVWEWSQDWYSGGKDFKVWRGGLGTLLLISSVLLPATTSIRTLDATTVGFSACQDWMRNRISHLPHLA